MTERDDPYQISAKTITSPPDSVRAKLRFLGPGFILSASIVGSGELIATTTLGATAGFTAFWVIIISCMVKVAIQLEFGKHTILTGETAMQIFNKLPGPKFGKGRWSVWLIFLLLVLKFVQLGGMIGTAAIVLQMLFEDIPVWIWVFVCSVSVSLFIYKGYYRIIERVSLFLVGMFTLLTLTAVFALNFTPYSITWQDIMSGLTFKLSGGMIAVAIGAFGLTGVASDEIIAYNYWCIEKGYAAYTGPHQDTPEWRRRASGWINIMYLDAIVAMVVYTLVTGAFYILGAAILFRQGAIPAGNELIRTVAMIYTESLGEWVTISYLIGAFFVLFSSLFATLAAWTRIYPDIFAQLGWINFQTMRAKVIAVLAWFVPVAWALIFLFMKLPLAMILFGGAVGSVMLFVIVFTALDIKYKRAQFFTSGWFYDTAFWISVVSILAVGVYGIAELL